jgi:hypothetical protein
MLSDINVVYSENRTVHINAGSLMSHQTVVIVTTVFSAFKVDTKNVIGSKSCPELNLCTSGVEVPDSATTVLVR